MNLTEKWTVIVCGYSQTRTKPSIHCSSILSSSWRKWAYRKCRRAPDLYSIARKTNALWFLLLGSKWLLPSSSQPSSHPILIIIKILFKVLCLVLPMSAPGCIKHLVLEFSHSLPEKFPFLYQPHTFTLSSVEKLPTRDLQRILFTSPFIYTLASVHPSHTFRACAVPLLFQANSMKHAIMIPSTTLLAQSLE